MILLIPALAVSYYFGVVLPANERTRLQLEKDKYEAEKKEKAEQHERAASNEKMLGFCVDGTDAEYWSYIKLNGTPVAGKPGTYSAPTYIWEAAQKRKNDGLAECHKEYGQ